MASRAEEYDRAVIRDAKVDMDDPAGKLEEAATRVSVRRMQELSVADAVRRRKRRRVLPGGGGSLI